MNSKRDLYYVAVKVFLKKNGKLFIFKDKYGDWDLPGGRIRENEFNKPLEKVIERKIKEELGDKICYKIGKPVVFMRHERKEVDFKGKKVRIFAIGYEGKFLSGEIKLSSMHAELLWVPIKSFDPKKYFKGGWLKGVEEYLKIKNR